MLNQNKPVYYRYRSSGKRIKLTVCSKYGAYTVQRCAHLFHSTNFPTVRHITPLGCRERCRTHHPRCRGPPLLKSRFTQDFRRTGGPPYVATIHKNEIQNQAHSPNRAVLFEQGFLCKLLNFFSRFIAKC